MSALTDEELHDELVFEGDKEKHDLIYINCKTKHHYKKNKEKYES